MWLVCLFQFYRPRTPKTHSYGLQNVKNSLWTIKCVKCEYKMSKVDAQFLVTLAVAFFCICKVGSPQNVLGSSLQYNIGLFYTWNRALLHRTQGSLQTEEIGLKTITTAKISNKFSQESPYVKLNMFSRESPKFVTGLQVSKWSKWNPVTQKSGRENRQIWRSKYFRSLISSVSGCMKIR